MSQTSDRQHATFVKNAFDFTMSKYVLSLRHDHDQDHDQDSTKKIDVNMLSDADRIFPCELHELLYVFPNMTFLPTGCTFQGILEKFSLFGKRTDCTGLVVSQEGMETASGRQDRLLTMPPHSFSINESGKFTLKCKSVSEEERLEGSEDPTLFSNAAVHAFIKETLRRVEWIQTERSGCFVPFRFEGQRLRTASLELETVSVRNVEDVIPMTVQFVRLDFFYACEIASEIYETLPPIEKRMYKPPRLEDDIKRKADNDGALDWGDDIVRRIVEHRIDQWNLAALDGVETPHLRDPPELRVLAAFRHAVQPSQLFKPTDHARSKAMNYDMLSARQNRQEERSRGMLVAQQHQGSTRANASRNGEIYRKSNTHTFFHPITQDTEAEWEHNLNSMLLRTSVVIGKIRREYKPDDRQIETIYNVLRKKRKDYLQTAMRNLHVCLLRIPVFNPNVLDDETVVASGTILFRRLLYLLSKREVIRRLATISQKSPTTGINEAEANELFERLLEFRNELETRKLDSIVEEYNVLNKIIEALIDVHQTRLPSLSQQVPIDVRTAKLWNPDSRVDIIVDASTYGSEPHVLSSVLAHKRGNIINATRRGILRLFYDPSEHAIKEYFGG